MAQLGSTSQHSSGVHDAGNEQIRVGTPLSSPGEASPADVPEAFRPTLSNGNIEGLGASRAHDIKHMVGEGDFVR